MATANDYRNDPLYLLLDADDELHAPQNGEQRLLADMQGEMIELDVCFAGGFINIVGRVNQVNQAVWVGKMCFYASPTVTTRTRTSSKHPHIEEVYYTLDVR